MASLIYAAITSLDGFVADADGNFDWAAPDDEVHRFVNGLERAIGTYLYGRRMYEVMRYWENPPTFDERSSRVLEYAQIWQSTDKVVYSTTLASAPSARTTLERSFDADAVRQLKATAERDISVGGAHLAAQAIAAGLVDEIHQIVSPVIVGGGTRFLPANVRMELTLLDERRFANGVVYLRYRAKT